MKTSRLCPAFHTLIPAPQWPFSTFLAVLIVFVHYHFLMVQKNCTIILIYAQISRQNCKLLLQLSHCVILGCLAFPFFFLRTPLSQWHPPLWVPSRTGPSCSPGVLSLCPPGSQLCPSCYPYTMSPSFLIYSFILEVHTLL